MVRFHLVHFSVQVATWWWSNYSHGLIWTKGVFYWFCWHCCACGAVTVNLFVVLTTLEFSLSTILSNFRVVLSSDRRPVLGIVDYRHCFQLFLHWGLKLLIKFSCLIFLSSIHSRFKFMSFATKNHKAILFSKWVHHVPPITGIMLSFSSRIFIL